MFSVPEQHVPLSEEIWSSQQQTTLTIGLDARCIVFGNNVGSDPFNADTFMGLADWIGIVTTCGAPVQEINHNVHKILTFCDARSMYSSSVLIKYLVKILVLPLQFSQANSKGLDIKNTTILSVRKTMLLVKYTVYVPQYVLN